MLLCQDPAEDRYASTRALSLLRGPIGYLPREGPVLAWCHVPGCGHVPHWKREVKKKIAEEKGGRIRYLPRLCPVLM
eukprot:1981368-Rhodomonas_salina.6